MRLTSAEGMPQPSSLMAADTLSGSGWAMVMRKWPPSSMAWKALLIRLRKICWSFPRSDSITGRVSGAVTSTAMPRYSALLGQEAEHFAEQLVHVHRGDAHLFLAGEGEQGAW